MHCYNNKKNEKYSWHATCKESNDDCTAHTTLHSGKTMHRTLIHLFIALICCLPTIASAATSQSIHVEWGYTPPGTPSVTGYKLYQEGALACQTQDPAATVMDCQVTLVATTTNFTLTATFSDNTESPHSAPYTFSTPSEPTAPLSAVITTDTLTGPAPLSIDFNASSSTGTISNYKWDFGDGTVTTGPTASHMYSTAGSYNAKLTVTSSTGQISTDSATITVQAATVPPAPPTAVISTSSAAGTAPLNVSFNGSGSTSAANTSIVSYAWSFGDGQTATGATPSHIFTAAGTYTTILIVTDSTGETNSANTPIVVTVPTTSTNKTPTASAKATPASGPKPLPVTFDGSGSTDSDGTITSYVWNFGDGSSANGKTASHTYTADASYSATLEVTDNQGAKSITTIPISVNPADPADGLNIELGEVAVGSTWVRVPLNSSIQNPIVIAGPPSINNLEPCVVHLRNVTQTSFEIKLDEWNYQDGVHPAETISYLVMEKGRHILPDGSSVEAGNFEGTTKYATIGFSKPFTRVPVVMTTIASANKPDTIAGRMKNIGTSGFAYAFREQERNVNIHGLETVNYIAWEPGAGTIGSVQFEVAKTTETITNIWSNRSFTKPFPQPPILLADMQTINDTDPSALRVQKIAATGFQVSVQEETSKTKDITHGAESVGYLSFDKLE